MRTTCACSGPHPMAHAAAAAAAAWAIGWGPLHAQVVRMDPAWLGVLASKDYLFATGWPSDMWATALLYVAVVGGVFALRRSRNLTHPREGAALLGLAALLAIFALTLPL